LQQHRTGRHADRTALHPWHGHLLSRRGRSRDARKADLRAKEQESGVVMARVEGEIIIARPVEEVFDFVADERNQPRYNPRMVRAEQVSSGPIGAATQFQTELKTMGERCR
jgi:hypothetical protein